MTVNRKNALPPTPKLLEALAAGALKCRTCQLKKRISRDLAESGYSLRSNGQCPSECRGCANARSARYKRSPEAIRRNRHPARVAATRKMQREWAKKNYVPGNRCGDVARVKVQKFIHAALKGGRVARADRCARCRRGPSKERGGYRLAGWFPPGRSGDLSALEQLCYPCLSLARHPERAAELEEERRDEIAIERARAKRASVRAGLRDPRAKNLAQHVRCRPRAAWAVIHAENVERVEAERAELAAAEARHGRRYAALLGAHYDWPEPERTRRVRALAGSPSI